MPNPLEFQEGFAFLVDEILLFFDTIWQFA